MVFSSIFTSSAASSKAFLSIVLNILSPAAARSELDYLNFHMNSLAVLPVNTLEAEPMKTVFTISNYYFPKQL